MRFPQSARSVRRHKARGVRPGIECQTGVQPAERATDIRKRSFHQTIRSRYLKIGRTFDSVKSCRPLRGLGRSFGRAPGACAPRFMLSRAPRAPDESARMPRKMTTVRARRLVFLLAVLIATAAVVAAQSGRRSGVKPSVPAPSPVASPPEELSKPKTPARIQLLVAIDSPSGFDGVPFHSQDIVLDACVRRIAESKDVMPTPAPRPMTRSEGLKAAKAETVRYVVWLQVRNERADYGAEVSAQSAQLYVTYVIYEPGTAKLKGSGRAQYGRRLGNVGVSGPSTRDAVYSDHVMKETAKLAADKILDAFQSKVGGWPR